MKDYIEVEKKVGETTFRFNQSKGDFNLDSFGDFDMFTFTIYKVHLTLSNRFEIYEGIIRFNNIDVMKFVGYKYDNVLDDVLNFIYYSRD